MKFIRSLLVFICGVLLFGATITYYSSTTTQHLFQEDLTKLMVDNISIEKSVEDILQSANIAPAVRKQILEESEKVKQDIVSSKEFATFVDTYSTAILNNVIHEESIAPNIDQDIRSLISAHEKEIKSAMGTLIGEQQKNEVIKTLNNSIDLNPVYDTVLGIVRENVTPKQKQLIQFIDILSSDFTKVIGLVTMIAMAALIILLKFHPFRWMFAVGLPFVLSGSILIIGAYLTPIIYGTQIEQISDYLGGLTISEFDRMARYGYAYLGFGFLLCMLHFVFKISLRRRIRE